MSKLRTARATTLQFTSRPQSVDEMTPGDLLHRLAVRSPNDYRAVIAIARERYKQLWPCQDDILKLRNTGT